MINQFYSTRKSGLAYMFQVLMSLLPVSLKWLDETCLVAPGSKRGDVGLVAVGTADLLDNFKQAYTKQI